MKGDSPGSGSGSSAAPLPVPASLVEAMVRLSSSSLLGASVEPGGTDRWRSIAESNRRKLGDYFKQFVSWSFLGLEYHNTLCRVILHLALPAAGRIACASKVRNAGPTGYWAPRTHVDRKTAKGQI